MNPFTVWHEQCEKLKAALEQAERERDELQQVIGEAKAACMTYNGLIIPNECSLLENVQSVKAWGYEMERERDEALALLAALRPILARAEPVFTPPKGDCIWGAPERDALLARLDATLGGDA